MVGTDLPQGVWGADDVSAADWLGAHHMLTRFSCVLLMPDAFILGATWFT